MIIRVFQPFTNNDTEGANVQTFQNRQKSVIVDEVISYDVTRKWCGSGSFSIVLPLTERNLTVLQVGYILAVDGMTVNADWLIINEVSYDTQSCKITVTGKDLNSLLSLRRTVFGSEQEAGAQGYDIVSGTTAECVEHYLDNNMISPVDTERTMPHFTFLSSSAAGIQNDSYMSRLEDLEMVVEDLCSNANLGYRIYGRAANNWDDYVFRLLQGTDRSVEQSSNPVVILSGVFQNIVGANFTHSVNNYYNAAYATGANDITQTVYRDSNTPVGYSRRETAIDVGDVGVSDIRQYALYQLRDNIAVSSVSVNICEGIYGSKFTLGDTVTAQDDLTGNLFTGVVTEVQKSISGTAQKTSITLGSGSQKLLNRIVTGIYNGTIRRR